MNTNTAVKIEMENQKPELTLVGFTKEVRYTKAGTVDKRTCHKVAGQSSEVYPLRTDDEIQAVLKVCNEHIEEAETPTNKQIAERDKMLFVIGINIGIRASDLCALKWSFFFDVDNNGNKTFKEHYRFQPKKQKRCGKYVTLKFNKAVESIVNSYLEKYPVKDLDTFIFASRKGNESISEKSMCRIVKDLAIEAGLKQNVGSHSLRKTTFYRIWNAAADKDKTLVLIQYALGHSDIRTTMKYIGILQDDVDELYDSICLGVE